MFKTRFTDLVGIQWPIVQAPMIGGFSSPEMVATVSNLGCLGTLALGNSSPDDIEQLYTATRKLTKKPFAVNLFVSNDIKLPTHEEKSKSVKALQPSYDELGIDPSYLHHKSLTLPIDLNTQIETILRLNVPIVSFTFGIPSAQIISKLKQKGIVIVGTATNQTEAMRVQQKGFDAVILQGIEAGGHRASFLSDGTSGPSTSLLNQQTSESITIPKILTGGIMTGQQIASYIGQGADACQLGSAYLFTDEAKLDKAYLDRLLAGESQTCLSKGFTGKYARVVSSKFTDVMKNKAVLAFPFQGQLTMDMRTKATAINENDFVPFWAGESASIGQRQSTASLTHKLISDLRTKVLDM